MMDDKALARLTNDARNKLEKHQQRLNEVLHIGDRIKLNPEFYSYHDYVELLQGCDEAIYYGLSDDGFTNLRVESVLSPGIVSIHADSFMYFSDGRWIALNGFGRDLP